MAINYGNSKKKGATEANAKTNTSSGSSSSGSNMAAGGVVANTGNTGATYKVNADGKAPTGLKAGDNVVTSGGTYQITGVNADGTYKSSLINDTTTKNYTGTYATAPTYTPTNAYNGTVAGSDNVDYSVLALQKMAEGASPEEIQNLYNMRLNKAISTPGLEKYVNDDVMRQMLDYINAGFDEGKPTYESQYDPAIKELVNQILNRDDFSYNAESDPLYQQYASMYRREGDRAMRDTMAEAAASAGGMNSYAITAAQQANNNYMAQLNDKIPELYQLAYEMYLQDKESKIQDLGILQGLDATDYGRYRDTMSDFYNDKNFAYNQFINDRNFTYGSAQDYVSNQWRDKEWANTLEQQGIQNDHWDKEWNREEERYTSGIEREDALLAKQEAQTQAYALLELGQMPPASLLEAAGIDPAYASAYLTGVKQQQAAKASSGGSGGSGDDSKKKVEDEPKKKTEESEYQAQRKEQATATDLPFINAGHGTADAVPSRAWGLGLGPIDDATYRSLLMRGAVVEDEDGNVEWANGWSADRWKDFSNTGFKVIGLPF